MVGCREHASNERKTVDSQDVVEPEDLFEKTPPGITCKEGVYKMDTTVILSKSNLSRLTRMLDSTELNIGDTYQDTPQIVQTFLDSISGGFSIADSGENWQSGCVRIVEINGEPAEELPKRQLVFLGMSKNLVVITYYTGGVGVSTNLLLIRYDKNSVLNFWKGTTAKDPKTWKETHQFLRDYLEEEGDFDNSFFYL